MAIKSCLDLEERYTIQKMINDGSSISDIAKALNRSKSTISREIKNHREVIYSCKLEKECAIYKNCPYDRTNCNKCDKYVKYECVRRDRYPGTCNGCENYRSCRFSKFKYDALKAYNISIKERKESREGINLTEEEMSKLSSFISPLLIKGQSPYAILASHPEIHISEKSLYNYIENDFFKKDNVSVMNLRRFLSRKITKSKKNLYKKRKDGSYLINRKYEDYQKYLTENPDAEVVQMDTVYNDVTNGPFMQTFKFIKYGLLFAVYQTSKTADDMNKGVDLLESILGPELFKKYVNILLTDRGSEFTDARYFENKNTDKERLKVFYCDPMASCQKGSLENNHEELRYILPKEHDLKKLGLTSQENLNTIISNINSYPKKALKGKTAFETCEFFAPDLLKAFLTYGLKRISADQVQLNTELIIPRIIKK